MDIVLSIAVWVVGFALIALAMEHMDKPYK